MNHSISRPAGPATGARTHRCAAMALALLAAGCTVGPDFRPPAPPAVTAYTGQSMPAQTVAAAVTGGAAQTFSPGADIPGQWWSLFRSARLNELIAAAFAANPTVQAAQAALRRANENVYAQEGDFYPKVDGSAGVSRQKDSDALRGGQAASVYNLFNATVAVSYTLDVFGGTRRRVESLAAQADFQRFQLEATYLTLAANVATAAIQIASLRGQIATTEDIVQIQSDALEVLRQQLSLGAISVADVLAQEAQLAQTRATLPPLQKSLTQTHNLLAALIGRFPSEVAAQDFDLATLYLPENLPVSLPSALVRQRPDIRSSESLLHSASAEIGVATANMLPQITLSADLGRAATQAGELFSPGTGLWSIAAGLAQPIFNANQLQHQKRAAVAAYEQAAAEYRSTVLNAFQNVADALRALEYDAHALQAQLAAERAAQRSLDVTREQFSAGAISYLTLLNAQRTLQEARLGLVRAQASRYADTAALFQALGGGWWNRPEAVATR